MAEGIPAEEIGRWSGAMAEFEKLGLVTRSEGIVCLTRRGKLLADSVAEAFVSTP
jgi:oxygen-independent coproporphyrinogen-3 oxidase